MRSLSILLAGAALAFSGFVSAPANASFEAPLCSSVQQKTDAPAPVDAGRSGGRNFSSLDLSRFGFVLESNGSWSCYSPSTVQSGWRITTMTASYDPGTNLVVGGSFLERGDFGPNQRQATVRFFTELAGNYGNLSFEDRQAVENYFAEVVERIEAGRMQPSRTWNDVHLKSRVRVMYTNYGDGTALYLNVPYRAR